ncbi:MAG: hypothetical protein Q8L21_01820 [Candidatus Komeilibacteria bacterium]|nr:hypothetical protein [Candidatus Komeilibacteria bacterium]
MDLSIFLAKIIGAYLVLASIALIVRGKDFLALVREASRHRLCTFITAMLGCLAGLAIIISHQVWSGWVTVITVLGWWVLLKNFGWLMFPNKLAHWGENMLKDIGRSVWISLAGLFGAWLLLKGFGLI